MSGGVSKAASRTKQSMLTTLGKADTTVDEEFNRLHADLVALQQDLMKQIKAVTLHRSHVLGLSEQHQLFGESLRGFYDTAPRVQADMPGKVERWSGQNMKMQASMETYTEQMQLAIDQLTEFADEIKGLKPAVESRNKKLLDFDATRRIVKNYTAKPPKDPSKLPRAEADMGRAEKIFWEENDALKALLPSYLSRRFSAVDAPLKIIMIAEQKWTAEMAEMASGAVL